MRTIALFGLLASLVGCANVAPTEESSAKDPAAGGTPVTAEEASVVHRTVVRRHADGRETAEEETVPIEQAARERESYRAARSAGSVQPEIRTDGSCGGASMWIFDHTSAHPGGTFPFNHEICFYDEGSGGCADLRKYARYCYRSGTLFNCADWASGYNSSVASFFSGKDTGYFTGTDGSFTGTASFGTDYQVDDTSAGAGDPWYFARHAQFLCF